MKEGTPERRVHAEQSEPGESERLRRRQRSGQGLCPHEERSLHIPPLHTRTSHCPGSHSSPTISACLAYFSETGPGSQLPLRARPGPVRCSAEEVTPPGSDSVHRALRLHSLQTTVTYCGTESATVLHSTLPTSDRGPVVLKFTPSARTCATRKLRA